MKRALVCGADGFIGGHLARRLVGEGTWVRAVGLTEWPYGETGAAEQVQADLRDPDVCIDVVRGGFDEIYQLAADMGGMEFISAAETAIMHNNTRINANMVDAAARSDVDRFFFSSSVCVYRDMQIDEDVLLEEDAYPAAPDNEYGWEKLYAERTLQTYARHHQFHARIARFENCFGPLGAWRGSREKAPAALCRKVAMADPGEGVELFGGGTTVRSFVYVEDLVDAVITLTRSEEDRPTNIGTEESVTIKELLALISDVANKEVGVKAVAGPLGVQSRNFSHDRMRALGWDPKHSLRAGIEKTYPWIAEQVARLQSP